MLFVVNKNTNRTMFAVDAWVSDCFERASKFIDENDLFLMRTEITFNGDMIWWVIENAD